MNPAVISAILKAVPASYQMFTGISQGIKARKLAKKKRPEYVIPGEINDNVDLAKGAYNAASMYGLPGQGRIQNQLMSSQAQAQEGIMQSQQNPASMLLGLSSVNQNTNNSIADLGVNAAQFRQNNMYNTQGRLIGANEALARYKDKEFELNKLKPFQDAMAASSAMRNASQANIYGGLGAGSNAMSGLTNKGAAPSGGGQDINPNAASGNGMSSGGGQSGMASPVSGERMSSGTSTASQQSNDNRMFNEIRKDPEFEGMTDEQIGQRLRDVLKTGKKLL